MIPFLKRWKPPTELELEAASEVEIAAASVPVMEPASAPVEAVATVAEPIVSAVESALPRSSSKSTRNIPRKPAKRSIMARFS